jgi:signal recognition particle subunit SRP54
MRSMMKQMKKGGLSKMMRAMGGLSSLRGGPPGAPKR